MSLYRRGGKRLFDLILGTLLFVVTLPLMAVIGTLVRIKLGSPVLFRQERPGKDGRIFRLAKFRTMTNSKDAEGALLPDEDRLTGFGQFLRSTSLDEMPEIAAVVKGEMSLVGPRPLLVEYLERYTPEQARRHEIRPGVTGWAQVNGRNDMSWTDKFAMDVWYVENYSVGLDLMILWRTINAVTHRSGIAHEGHATAPRFEGAIGDG